MRTFLAPSLLTILFCVSSNLFALDNGQQAFPFVLPGQDGKLNKLSDYKGKYVVLEWFNEGCPYVKKHYETGNMQALQTHFAKNAKVVWFSVVSSTQGKQGHYPSQEKAKEAFKMKKMASRALLLDQYGNVGQAYNARTTPHMFIVNPEGVLVYQGAIDSNSSASAKTVADAKPLFKDALNTLLAGKKLPSSLASNKPYGCSVKY